MLIKLPTEKTVSEAAAALQAAVQANHFSVEQKLEGQNFVKSKETVMKRVLTAVILSGALGVVPVLAQEKQPMPTKEGMPMKGNEMQGGGMMMGKMKDMQSRMNEMCKAMSGTMKGQGMMKSEDMQRMGKTMGDMSSMMGEMKQMTDGAKMTPEEMQNMSTMMGDMSGMMKQMSERMGRGMKKTQ